MEDAIEVYHRPPGPARPVVSVDVAGKQLFGDVRPPLPVRPGSPAREDSEDARGGTANLIPAFDLLAGRRRVEVTERRTAHDFAGFLKRLLDESHPDAATVVLVTDNLNTHAAGSLYEASPPEEARRLAERIEWHDTRRHGSWRNMAETELSVLARQCLSPPHPGPGRPRGRGGGPGTVPERGGGSGRAGSPRPTTPVGNSAGCTPSWPQISCNGVAVLCRVVVRRKPIG